MNYLRSILNAPAERLALFRLSLGFYLVAYLLVRLPGAWDTMLADPADFRPVGAVAWLGQSAPLAPSFALIVYMLGIALALAYAVGFYFSWTGPLTSAFVLWITSYKSSFGMLFHSENLFTLQTCVIGFSPASTVLGWDARRKAWPSRTTIPSGWPLLAACLIGISVYLVAGIAKLKLSGMDWASGDVLRIQVAYDNVRKIEFGSPHSPFGAFSVRHPWLFPPLGTLTLIAELGGLLALLHRRLALAWVVLVIGFHWGVFALMAITFSYPMSGIPFLPFFALERSPLSRWAQRTFGRKDASNLSNPPVFGIGTHRK